MDSASTSPIADAGQGVRHVVVDAALILEAELKPNQLGHRLSLNFRLQIPFPQRTQTFVVDDDLEGATLEVGPPLVDGHHDGEELFLVGWELLVTSAEGLAEVGDGVTILDENGANVYVTEQEPTWSPSPS